MRSLLKLLVAPACQVVTLDLALVMTGAEHMELPGNAQLVLALLISLVPFALDAWWARR